MTIRELVSKNIKELRKARGLTQEQLAVQARLTHTYLNRVECCEANISIDSLEGIVSALGVPITALFTGADEPKPSKTKINALMSDMRAAIELLERNLVEAETKKKKASSTKKKAPASKKRKKKKK